jgi:hypothetical protein
MEAGSVKFRALDELPLFADDMAIGAALLGAARAGEWKAIAPLLEQKGLPKIDQLHGGRYVPAVKSFYDRDNLIAVLAPASPDGVEHPESWSRERRRRA